MARQTIIARTGRMTAKPYFTTWLFPVCRQSGHYSTQARFWGLIFRNSLWDEFISIPKEVIGMATTCEEKSRAVPKVIRSGV